MDCKREVLKRQADRAHHAYENCTVPYDVPVNEILARLTDEVVCLNIVIAMASLVLLEYIDGPANSDKEKSHAEDSDSAASERG